jgi:dolichol-phosphate mannosyltransferase
VQLTVVIPTYNESKNLPKIVAALFSRPLPELKILVVDDNSPDGTGMLADEMATKRSDSFTVIHRAGKLGLGSAYLHGFNRAVKAGAQAVAQMDADFSHPPEKIIEMLSALQHYDLALGSRYLPGGGVDENWPVWRKSLSAFGNFYTRLILGLPVKDATGGFRIWRRETLLGMPLDRVRSNGYAFQVEMIYLAYKLGFSFLEIPFYFADRKWGQSKMSFTIQVEAAIRVWQLRYEYRNLRN